MAILVAIQNNKKILELNVPVSNKARLPTVQEPQFYFHNPLNAYSVKLMPIGQMGIDEVILVFDEFLKPTVEPTDILYAMRVTKEGHVAVELLIAQCNQAYRTAWIGRQIVFIGTIGQLAAEFEYHWLHTYAQNAIRNLGDQD